MSNLPANSGCTLEKTIKSVLHTKGFEIVRYREWKVNPDEYGHELLLTHVPFRTIYNHNGITEFLLKSKKYNLETRIECKWQQVAGSVDEKLPYLYLNAIEKMPENNIIIIIDGDGWKLGSKEWLKRVVLERKYTSKENNKKDIMVMNLQEFLTWSNKIFR